MSRGCRRASALVAFALLLPSPACHSGGGEVAGTPVVADLRVLFIGNSLTYQNNLPEIVRAIAETAGGPAIEVRTVAFPDFSLEDHWNRGDALRAIDEGGWDVVVLQQGPSTLPESRANLVEWTGRFAERIRAVGGRPALHSVWPPRSQANGFDLVRASYAGAAEAVDGILIPAGEAWRAVWAVDPNVPLYAGDDFHPSVLGSVTAAYVIWQRLTGRSPVGLPPVIDGGTSVRIDLGPERAALLQEAAAEANSGFGQG
ncbi:MAG TPA: SGNH/GDSL hydrolase family protein [Gemmatimonadota bacterium]|nr:SGNH/GDSL hydrolase family protein [Gemmatimonadota bacterium]